MLRDQTVICLTTHALIVYQTVGRTPPPVRESYNKLIINSIIQGAYKLSEEFVTPFLE
jgi:hypothetical protein